MPLGQAAKTITGCGRGNPCRSHAGHVLTRAMLPGRGITRLPSPKIHSPCQRPACSNSEAVAVLPPESAMARRQPSTSFGSDAETSIGVSGRTLLGRASGRVDSSPQVLAVLKSRRAVPADDTSLNDGGTGTWIPGLVKVVFILVLLTAPGAKSLVSEQPICASPSRCHR